MVWTEPARAIRLSVLDAEWFIIAAVLAACLIWRVGHYLYWRTRFGGLPALRGEKPDAREVIVVPGAAGVTAPDGGPVEPAGVQRVGSDPP